MHPLFLWRRHRFPHLAALLLMGLASVGVGCDIDGEPDAGASADAGTSSDAGPSDAGVRGIDGGGLEPDAGSGELDDGGLATDAGNANEDAGPTSDVTLEELAVAIVEELDDCEAFIVEIGLLDFWHSPEALVEAFRRSEDNPLLVFNQEATNGCHASVLDGRFCEQLALNGTLNGDCQFVYSGTLSEGDACDENECSRGLLCTSEDEMCGSCAVLPGDGEGCLLGRCAEGFACHTDRAFPTCGPPAPPPVAGDTCEEFFDCPYFSGLTCADGVCAPILTASLDQECDPSATVCTPVSSVRCLSDGEDTFSCQALPNLGDACVVEESTCLEGFCDETLLVCVPPLSPGDTCSGGQCGSNAFCNDDSVCQEYLESEEMVCTE